MISLMCALHSFLLMDKSCYVCVRRDDHVHVQGLKSATVYCIITSSHLITYNFIIFCLSSYCLPHYVLPLCTIQINSVWFKFKSSNSLPSECQTRPLFALSSRFIRNRQIVALKPWASICSTKQKHQQTCEHSWCLWAYEETSELNPC